MLRQRNIGGLWLRSCAAEGAADVRLNTDRRGGRGSVYSKPEPIQQLCRVFALRQNMRLQRPGRHKLASLSLSFSGTLHKHGNGEAACATFHLFARRTRKSIRFAFSHHATLRLLVILSLQFLFDVARFGSAACMMRHNIRAPL